jgi:GrpB-like predicted nucleotidyltransferase (UPF0157 family)
MSAFSSVGQGMTGTGGGSDVRIRPYTRDDVVPAWEAVRESLAELRLWMPWCHPGYSIEDLRSWIDAQVPAFDRGVAFEFVIVAADGRWLGGCGLNQLDAVNPRANLGCWVRTSAAGRGVATTAVGLLRQWGFAHTNLRRLELVIAVGNTASHRVAEKAGAAREGVLRDRLLLHGATHDATLFSFTAGAARRAVAVTGHQARWAHEFRQMAGRIRALVGGAALRIDHIGSTAVPGLGAKDVIDIQITVADLDAAAGVTAPLRAAGFRQGATFEHDVFRPMRTADSELRKLFVREPEGERRAHVHVREHGRFNQRYALLCRDYLRASPEARAEYEAVKRQAARLFPYSIDGYLSLKEPVFHLIYQAAALWAERVGWSPGDRDA